jgi:ArsR family transcriptional regulator
MSNKPPLQELRVMHATLCQAIADPIRIALLYELSEEAKHVTQMVETFELPQATVSRHLKILRDQNLVTAERRGAYVYYSLADDRVIEALDIMRNVLTDTLAHQHSLAQKTTF